MLLSKTSDSKTTAFILNCSNVKNLEENRSPGYCTQYWRELESIRLIIKWPKILKNTAYDLLKEVCNRTRTIAAKEINTVIHNGNIATKWSFQSNNPHQT